MKHQELFRLRSITKAVVLKDFFKGFIEHHTFNKTTLTNMKDKLSVLGNLLSIVNKHPKDDSYLLILNNIQREIWDLIALYYYNKNEKAKFEKAKEKKKDEQGR